MEGYLLSSANQEHGVVSAAGAPDAVSSDIASVLPVGTQLRILPNHACATGAQFPEYLLVGADGAFTALARFYGW